jgi:hypothetical protein
MGRKGDSADERRFPHQRDEAARLRCGDGGLRRTVDRLQSGQRGLDGREAKPAGMEPMCRAFVVGLLL